MSNATGTITEFLLARIAEDEAEARSVLAEYEESPPSVYEMAQVPMLDAGAPDRVLAECEAKRRILDDWEALTEENDGSERDRAMIDNLNDVMEYLAAVYADHPDYRDEWRP